MGPALKRAGGRRGGIAGLALAIERHGSAFEHDVMAATGRTLSEFIEQGPPGVVALAHFLAHIGPDTATWHELEGSGARMWSSTLKSNAVLADLFDVVSLVNRNIVQSGSRSRVKNPRPYPRPWDADTERIGHGPVRVSQFWDWWKSN